MVGLTVGLVVWLVTRPDAPQAGSAALPGPTSAGAILDERFANGEIDEDEYRRRVLLDGG
ncbi:MAG TPA: SHOCT domain-containing protein [Candidatus Limnocylindria bacterium]|nr:SHOCT domain-containing protein [Candidatus Limnocylindria bacterium]